MQMLVVDDQAPERFEKLLKRVELSRGLGAPSSPCSMAAMNLAIDGTFTDKAPESMSSVIARWIVVVQDLMPDDMRNSKQWKSLLPKTMFTGTERETLRQKLIVYSAYRLLPHLNERASLVGVWDAWCWGIDSHCWAKLARACKGNRYDESFAMVYHLNHFAGIDDCLSSYGRILKNLVRWYGDSAWSVIDPPAMLEALINGSLAPTYGWGPGWMPKPPAKRPALGSDRPGASKPLSARQTQEPWPPMSDPSYLDLYPSSTHTANTAAESALAHQL